MCLDLSMNLWILLMRKQFLLELANSGRSINDLKREYNFTEEDLEDLERMGID